MDLYQKREKIYIRKIEGFYQRIRVFTGWPLLVGYFYLPWINWNDKQAVLFDIAQRQFHIFGITLWPQDLSLLALGLILAAFALLFVTTIAGRIWCGYTCPQTVWTSIFMWIEQRVEGTRNQRMKLDAAPMSMEKATKKLTKHALWLFVGFYTGFTFVGYFTPIRELGFSFFQFDTSMMALFWIAFFTVATYGNAGWLREQVCMYMCPYARFQAVMFDQDTLIVSYDEQRGEPRGSRKRGVDPNEQGLGSCIDCKLCVQVCPTGIDIRDGLQYQCIDCALCVDACNSVMDKMNYPRGLIHYTTERIEKGEKTHFFRPKAVGYAAMVALMGLVILYELFTRTPLEISVLRDRQDLYQVTPAGQVENFYSIKISNKNQITKTYSIEISNKSIQTLQGNTTPTIAAGETQTVRVKLIRDPEQANGLDREVEFTVFESDKPDNRASRSSRFIAPLK